MSMIEGIGDEIIQFFGAVIIISVALIAWWSTNISDAPLIRTVLILERHSRSRTSNDSNPQPAATVTRTENTIDTGQSATNTPELGNNESESSSNNDDKDESESGTSLLLPAGPQQQTVEPQPQTVEPQQQPANAVSDDAPNQTSLPRDEEPQVEIEPTQDNSSTVPTDADSSVLRKRRLAFFQSRGPTLIEPSDVTDSSPASTTNATAEVVEEESDNRDHIRIRLKYLNDDQIVVEGRLHEQLGDFKRRHFSIELAAEKMVRLIFNGQVLQSDSQTLQGYGLFDNCVVHCLVHNQRSNAPRSSHAQANTASSQTTPPDWNLGTLLYTCLSVILGFAWYCRYQYSHLFTVTTTAALFGLTTMYAVTLLSIYLPDQETIQ